VGKNMVKKPLHLQKFAGIGVKHLKKDLKEEAI